MRSATLIGVDVGGTFTDLFFLDETGECHVAKVPSTRPDQSIGMRAGIAQHLTDLGAVSTIVHGTTVGTNALLERKGARAGVITTAGFRDVLEMRRRDRPQTWGLWGRFRPVVPRDLRLEVEERVLADGEILREVNVEQVREVARELRARGAESVCVFFINAYANPRNEQAALGAVREVWPNDHVTASSQILPEIREFERASTAALNAYLQPIVARYLETLQSGLGDAGFRGQILIVQSNGGVMDVNTARALPVRTALSGPAAGVIAAAYIADRAGFPDVITCDMGGTSFDVSLISQGESALTAQTAIDFGLVVRTPMIEITTIGAGGGSIARIDRGGLLQVGPDSAGSDPGPVCYGLGNPLPTVTDANVVMGRINAARPIGGKLERLDVEAAKAAIEHHIADPLGLGVMAAAEAIVRVANARMAGAIRLVSVERGHDPKRFSAMPFGGGGALHSGALIKDVGLASALVPRFPGVTSALGCVVADMRHDRVVTLNTFLDGLDVAEVNRRMSGIAGELEAVLHSSASRFETVEHRFEFDMLYLGQTHTVPVPLPVHLERGRTDLTIALAREAFDTAYQRAYGRLLEGIPVRIMNLRATVIGTRPKFDLARLAPAEGGSLEDAVAGQRPVWVDGQWTTATIYDRLRLPVGAIADGPAVLEQTDATIFVDPDLAAKVDDFGNLVIRRRDQP